MTSPPTPPGPAPPGPDALADAAWMLGLPDPRPRADVLIRLDPESVESWFGAAEDCAAALGSAGTAAGSAVPGLAQGWSNPGALARLSALSAAGVESAARCDDQAGAGADLAAELRAIRSAAQDEVDRAEAAVRAFALPPGDSLTIWVAQHGQVDALVAIIDGLHQGLDALHRRLDGALQAAIDGLAGDPRDAIQAIAAATPPPAGTAGPNPTGPVTGPGTPDVDRANRERLELDLQSSNPNVAQMALGVWQGLQEAELAGGRGQLLVYESAGDHSQGRAAISVGDITTADTVAVFVPGVGSAPAAMAGGVADAAILRDATLAQAPDEAAAAIAWYGYDIPVSWNSGVPVGVLAGIGDTLQVLDDEAAAAGGAALAADLAVLRTLTAASARVVGVGYSMGATTVSAAAGDGAQLDSVVLIAAPGAGNDVESVHDYPGVAPDQVFVSSSDEDPITLDQMDTAAFQAKALLNPWHVLGGDLTPFGPDPADADFGAQVMDVPLSLPPTIAPYPEFPFGIPNHMLGVYLAPGLPRTALGGAISGRSSRVPVKPGR